MRRSLGAAALLLALSGVGCATRPAVRRAAPVVELSRAVTWAAFSAEYHAAVHQAYANASLALDDLVEGREPGSWAIITDADETLISNVQYQIEREAVGEGYSTESWHAWCERAEAPALPGAVDFLNGVHEAGGRIVVVTNRRTTVHHATVANLDAQGIPYDLLLSQGSDGDGDKDRRFAMVEAGTASPDLPPLDVVMWLGDNINDFPGLDQRIRSAEGSADDAAYAAFGTRFILVPNPMYGSWVDREEE